MKAFKSVLATGVAAVVGMAVMLSIMTVVILNPAVVGFWVGIIAGVAAGTKAADAIDNPASSEEE